MLLNVHGMGGHTFEEKLKVALHVTNKAPPSTTPTFRPRSLLHLDYLLDLGPGVEMISLPEMKVGFNPDYMNLQK